MTAQVAILHGWNDRSQSFRKLEAFLGDNGFDVANIWLGDYVSKDDDVRIEDVAGRMHGVISERIATGDLQPQFDLIVHSTGGLVAREWIVTHYPDGAGCPVKRLLMLAPANFGSKLATMGNSVGGRAFVGFGNQFQTGREMLNALELASPFQRRLALRDLVDPDGATTGPYGRDKVWPFVLTGSRGYTRPPRSMVNEPGADGTIRVPAANLNITGLTVDFSADAARPAVRPWSSRTGGMRIPFGVLPDRDHTSIKFPGDSSGAVDELSERAGRMMIEALRCDSAQAYVAIAERWAQASEEAAELADDTQRRRRLFRRHAPRAQDMHRYLQTVIRVRDDQGQSVDDYFLEFFSPDTRGDASLLRFQSDILDDVHVNRLDASARCFYIDRDDLLERFYGGRTRAHRLAMSITAANPGRNIRYFDKEADRSRGSLVVHCNDENERAALGSARLHRNMTHFIDVIIPRKAVDRVFRLKR